MYVYLKHFKNILHYLKMSLFYTFITKRSYLELEECRQKKIAS